MTRSLVWLKRDLRLRDHAPLHAAESAREAAALFVIEPDWLASPEFSTSHLHFTLASLAELRRGLAARGLPLLIRVGALPAVLDTLRREFAFTELLSHEETGSGWTYARDLAVGRWCRAHGVAWREWPQTGVVRRLRSRHGWAGRWAQRMEVAPLPAPSAFRRAPAFALSPPDDLPTPAALGAPPLAQILPPIGEAAALDVLATFVSHGARGYRRALSSPLTATAGCSRLSAHLAFGTVSMRTVHHATEAAIASAQAAGDRALAYDLRGFDGRLHWHCHFMQKLEDEPEIEFRNFARICDGIRPGDGVHPDSVDEERLTAWRYGRTGYPMVDACMRSLVATGWLNFRMRAMLVSFAAYQLGLHWREPGLFLARQFLDFEPGIHWSQMQMQSGTTGINTLRIYSPAKQAREHDPRGEFVREWVPEAGTPDYPAPIVDERTTLEAVKARLYALRNTPAARAEADAVQSRHGSRKSGLPPSATRRRAQARTPKAPDPPSTQGELF